ncbi:antitoxin Xre/MbcA/ParS toxin-binding domain-containing protein [Ferrimonas marina]|uniref:Antitoxin Xre/MbcA/ParS-like toxin-binding domain-containing protein n=1 Tax=Ferrimonas marina TaxID=299255 RepID=A0A1M5TWW5_9GAMM|nr:antitoxin Xre/MbcA/ParS toxin-binding domain-containing protein [Ferrimonas marina]SHH55151.1 Protein of unknown function [Ferrimonas marina]
MTEEKDPNAVLDQAANRASAQLGLATFSGDPLLLVRAHTALVKLMGGDLGNMHHFMTTEHRSLNGRPAELVHSPAGLAAVVDYLESRQAPLGQVTEDFMADRDQPEGQERDPL